METLLLEVAELAWNQGVSSIPRGLFTQRSGRNHRALVLDGSGEGGATILAQLSLIAAHCCEAENPPTGQYGTFWTIALWGEYYLHTASGYRGVKYLAQAHAELGFEAGQPSSRGHALNHCANRRHQPLHQAVPGLPKTGVNWFWRGQPLLPLLHMMPLIRCYCHQERHYWRLFWRQRPSQV